MVHYLYNSKTTFVTINLSLFSVILFSNCIQKQPLLLLIGYPFSVYI